MLKRFKDQKTSSIKVFSRTSGQEADVFYEGNRNLSPLEKKTVSWRHQWIFQLQIKYSNIFLLASFEINDYINIIFSKKQNKSCPDFLREKTNQKTTQNPCSE